MSRILLATLLLGLIATISSRRPGLAPLILPSVRGIPTAGFVDAQGIYVAYGRAVYRYALDGTAETPLLNAAANVTWIVANQTHIFLYHSIYSSGTDVTSIAKATNTVVEAKDFWVLHERRSDLARWNGNLWAKHRCEPIRYRPNSGEFKWNNGRAER